MKLENKRPSPALSDFGGGAFEGRRAKTEPEPPKGPAHLPMGIEKMAARHVDDLFDFYPELAELPESRIVSFIEKYENLLRGLLKKSGTFSKLPPEA